MIEKLIEEFSDLQEVDAILLGGSRARNRHDETSDYDLYVYLNSELEEEKRRVILDKYCSYMEYSNHFWELEDDGELNNGIEIEFIYRGPNFVDEIQHFMKNKVVEHGYSTCFVDNIAYSKILVDKQGIFSGLQKQCLSFLTKDYVQKLIDYNYPILFDQIPALYKQIKKAISRNDVHSINHRVTAFFEVYYDILFAINNTLHPGEKRLLDYALKLENKPLSIADDVHKLFDNLYHDNDFVLNILEKLVMELKSIIIKLEYKI